ERRVPHALCAVDISADAERQAVGDRRRKIAIDAIITIGRSGETHLPHGLIKAGLLRDEVDRGSGAIRGKDTRGATLDGLDAIDRDILLKIFVRTTAAIDDRQAIFFQRDKGLRTAA